MAFVCNLTIDVTSIVTTQSEFDTASKAQAISSLAEQHVKLRRDGKVDGVNGSATRRWVCWMHRHGFQNWVLPAQILAAIWVKWAVGLGSYSGTHLRLLV